MGRGGVKGGGVEWMGREEDICQLVGMSIRPCMRACEFLCVCMYVCMCIYVRV